MKEAGLEELVAGWGGYESVLAIKNIRGRTVGFSLDVITTAEMNGAGIQAGHYQYLQVRPVGEVVWSFGGDEHLEEYFWKSEAKLGGGAVGVELTGTGENVTVQKYSERGMAAAESFRANAAAIPNALLDVFLAGFLESDIERAVFDLMQYDGTVKPIAVSRVAVPGNGRSSPAAFEVKVEIVDGRGYYQQVYFDGDKKVLQTLVQQEEPYVMERSDIPTLRKIFPERADELLYYYRSQSPGLF
jgi:hypothetical protein